jgi:hypothetical protein
MAPQSEPLSATAELSAEQKAAVAAIMAEAEAKARDVILGGNPVAGLGTPSNFDRDKVDNIQRDSLPGTRRKDDNTYVPEFVYDEVEQCQRRAKLPAEYHYVLVDIERIGKYIRHGWKHVLFDGGSRSGLAERGFKGTGDGIFRRTLEGYCQRGDCRYMYIENRAWEEIRDEDEYQASMAMSRALGSFANAGYREGIRAEAYVDGKPVFSDKQTELGRL